MKRRSFLKTVGVAGIGAGITPAWSVPLAASLQGPQSDASDATKAAEAASPEKILLKDYRPKSLYKIPVTEVPKAKFPIVDMHSHAYAKTAEEIAEWVRNIDEVGVAKTVILSGASGKEFDDVYRKYSAYPDRFELWCGFDYTGFDQPGFSERAIAALEKCHQAGARGVGELHDKGKGLTSDKVNAFGMHPDDARMDPVFERCGQLGMPVNIHVADPIWMYAAMDNTNDGLMNAFEWRLDNQPGIIGHSGMIDILERTVKKHSNTTFIACHFANLDYDLTRLGQILERHPNLYADIAARYAETAPIPRFTSAFYVKYADRLLYGTDMGFDKDMYRVTFRILETLDEHFYEIDMFSYHWSLNGFGLPDEILQKIYRTNAVKILNSHGTLGARNS
ncbi:MAG TPA: amidohydrolase family protein [Terriglobales bacterium]|nr:amidohydrolase family protein [Terriglobales bacterium]